MAHRTALRIVDGNGGPGIIDEQLFAGAVFLAQHHVQLTPPLLVEIAESTVAVSVGVCLSVLFPYQLQRQVGMLLEFFMDAGQIRLWLTVLIDPPQGPTEQSFFQLPVIPVFRQRPLDTSRLGPLQVFVNRGSPDRTATGDLPVTKT